MGMDKDLYHLKPFSEPELLEFFHREHGSNNKHLLTLYSLIVGLGANRVLELGVGSSTRAIRAALQHTGGELYSCDINHSKWGHISQSNEDENFHFYLSDSKSFIRSMKGPFDFVFHDAAHDRWQVQWDLEHNWPMVRKFGIICLHDTQHNILGDLMQEGLKNAFDNCLVSWTHIPYQFGMTIIRIEKDQPFKPISVQWTKDGYEGLTQNSVCGIIDLYNIQTSVGSNGKIKVWFSYIRFVINNFLSKWR